MSDGNNLMMIGLHKLAAERGDGLIPELLAIYERRDIPAENAADVIQRAAVTDEISMTFAGNDNVIPFRPYLQARKGR